MWFAFAWGVFGFDCLMWEKGWQAAVLGTPEGADLKPSSQILKRLIRLQKRLTTLKIRLSRFSSPI